MYAVNIFQSTVSLSFRRRFLFVKVNYFLTVPKEVIMKIIHYQCHTSGLFVTREFYQVTQFSFRMTILFFLINLDRYKICDEDYSSLKVNNIIMNSNLQNCAVAASSTVINYAAFFFQLSAKFVRSFTIHCHFCYLQP